MNENTENIPKGFVKFNNQLLLEFKAFTTSKWGVYLLNKYVNVNKSDSTLNVYQKSLIIEKLILNVYFKNVVIQKDITDKKYKLLFNSDLLSVIDDFYLNKFKLCNLQELQNLNGLYYKDLDKMYKESLDSSKITIICLDSDYMHTDYLLSNME